MFSHTYRLKMLGVISLKNYVQILTASNIDLNISMQGVIVLHSSQVQVACSVGASAIVEQSDGN